MTFLSNLTYRKDEECQNRVIETFFPKVRNYHGSPFSEMADLQKFFKWIWVKLFHNTRQG